DIPEADWRTSSQGLANSESGAAWIRWIGKEMAPGYQSLPAEVDATCTRFKLDDAVRNRLINAMRSRATFKEDMRTLNDVMRAARHPKGAVQLKLREIERGTFSAPASEPKPRRPGIPDVSYRLISSHVSFAKRTF
ncbi:unnamed protein product, partial [Effrenium voratum]